MLNGILLGIVFGVMVITGVAIAYNQFHVDSTPEANLFEILTDRQRQQLDEGHDASKLNLDEKQMEQLVKTLKLIDEYDLELSKSEKILFEYVLEFQDKGVTQKDVNLLKKEIADGLLKMGLNLKPEMLESLDEG